MTGAERAAKRLHSHIETMKEHGIPVSFAVHTLAGIIHEETQPTPEQIEGAVGELCTALGIEDHHYVSLILTKHFAGKG